MPSGDGFGPWGKNVLPERNFNDIWVALDLTRCFYNEWVTFIFNNYTYPRKRYSLAGEHWDGWCGPCLKNRCYWNHRTPTKIHPQQQFGLFHGERKWDVLEKMIHALWGRTNARLPTDRLDWVMSAPQEFHLDIKLLEVAYWLTRV